MNHFQGRCLLALEMGLGKTPVTLRWLAQSPCTFPAAVVCPATVKRYWERKAWEWIGKRAIIGEGRKPFRNPPADPQWLLVLNWDLLTYWWPTIANWRPHTLILDEVHFAANRKAKRTKAAKMLARRCHYCLGLSGTPLLNRPAELWQPLNIIRPDLYSSFFDYANRYCAPKTTFWGIDYSGSAHLDELHQRLIQKVMIRRTKTEVLPDLPDKIRSVVPLEMERPGEYIAARDDFLNWLATIDSDKARRAARAVAITRLGYLKRLAAQLKAKAVSQWIAEWMEANPDGKLVVFAVHRGMISAIQEAATVPTVVLHGGTHNREAVLREFQHSKTRLFIGQLRAAGVGVDGLQVASACVFAELDWRPADHTQAEDRLHRCGQKSTVMIYYLVGTDSIEETLCAVIQRKQATLSAVLDGGTQTGDLDVFDVLLKSLKGRRAKRCGENRHGR